MSDKVYELIIIGGGPAGYNAAERASEAGLSVLLAEGRALGGVCLGFSLLFEESLKPEERSDGGVVATSVA